MKKGHHQTLQSAIRRGVNARVRPVVMTALMAATGLLPAAVSHGIGSESSQPLARVVIGGIICAMFFSILIFPHFFSRAYRKFDPQHQSNEEENNETDNHKSV